MDQVPNSTNAWTLAAIMTRLLLISLTVVFSCQNEKTSQKIIPKDSIQNANLDTSLGSSGPNTDSVKFNSYWKLFRQASLNFDTSQLINLTAFPILARGSLDSDPQLEYSKKQFPKVFYFFLHQGNGMGGTEFDIIKNTETPKDKIIENQVRINDMVFYLIDKKWKLNFLYLDYDAIDSINHEK